MELKRNKTTGKVEVWKDGKKIGEIDTMGDHIKKEEEKRGRSKK